MKVEVVYKNCKVFREGEKEEALVLEKRQHLIFKTYSEPSILIADDIAALIKQKQVLNQACFLELNTKPKSIKVYEELVRRHKEEGLSFDNVVAIIKEDYVPIDKLSIESMQSFLLEHFLDHVDIHPENIQVLNQKVYKLKIKANGGLDFYFPEKEHYLDLNHIKIVNTIGSFIDNKDVIRNETILRIV